ncbi:Uncharacterised protein [Legionella busanensis]|uniref:Uncharacterized protein n=1 Tax=Legionella busanensis TaxID=190655 RepID=A0A378JR20_9GAMM|nr:hypothetical protein [Legionella busanensis]STX52629.1 Uncharacterised protein [Legionella busanensis]
MAKVRLDKYIRPETLENLKINKDFKASNVLAPAYNFLTGPVRSNTTSNFFAPYKGPVKNLAADVAKSVGSIIYAPLAWGVLSVAVAAVAVASAIASLGYLMMAGATRLAGKKEASADNLAISKQLGILAGMSAVGTVALAVMTAISGPENILKLGTRTFSTIKDKVSSQPKVEVEYSTATAYSF